MGIISTIMGFFGFGFGITIGILAGYFMFIYVQPSNVKDPDIRPLAEQESEGLQRLLPEIPLWVKNPDFDRLDWLNRFIETMWPYLDKAICKTVKQIADPIIAEQIPKLKIEAVEFEELTLGSLPPTFQGMKVYSTEEKELIMELSLKWAANPNILVAVKAFGLKATAQVLDLQVFALPRITLKPLVPSFPCFAKILVSLMEKPHVDFGLKLLGADLMSIPGLYLFVQVGSHDKMGVNIVHLKDLTPEEPKVLTLDLLKNLNRDDPQNEKSRGQLVLEVMYKAFSDEQMPANFEESKEVQTAPEGTPEGGGLFVVIVHEAQDLEGKHHTNPSVRLIFRGEEKRTKVIKKNRDPRWDEEFQFMLDKPPTNDKMHVEVVSTSSRMGLRHPKESLGYVDIPLVDVVNNKRTNERYHLIDSKNGRLQVELQWRTSS
nr:synaptotagmin-2-like [Ipomoea batatas]